MKFALLILAAALASCDGDTVAPTVDAGGPTESAPEVIDAAEPTAPMMEIVDPGSYPCDLTGTWMLTLRQRINALGAQQVSRGWHFLELAQDGDALRVSKSVLCGTSTEGLFPITVTVDDSAAWPTYQTKRNASFAGATGTSRAAGDGCAVSLERWVLVKGLSAEYSELSERMPSAEQQASAGKAGWEDWDNDGHPGITQHISGTLSGNLYVAIRFSAELAGTVDPSAASIQLPLAWTLEQATLGVDGSPLLAVQGSPEGDPNGQFAELARLPASALGDDVASTCSHVKDLTATLTPHAMQ